MSGSSLVIFMRSESIPPPWKSCFGELLVRRAVALDFHRGKIADFHALEDQCEVKGALW